MNLILIVCSLTTITTAVTIVPRTSESEEIPKRKPCTPDFTPSASCGIIGGICVKKGECPEGFQMSDLIITGAVSCPPGYDCCGGVSNKDTNCGQKHGNCKKKRDCDDDSLVADGHCSGGLVCCRRSNGGC